MPTSSTRRPEKQADGIVHSVDTVNREMAASVGGALVKIDVPPGCQVLLRGERVKFRMVLPGDHVRVTYAEVRGSLVARTVLVQPGQPPGEPPR